MDILTRIINHKQKEVEEKKSLYPLKLLERSIYFQTNNVSFKKYILKPDKSGIIAEFKTRSPSRGDINPYADIKKISVEYMRAGASALSVLTDRKFFGGDTRYLTEAREYNYCPILQKDFFIDEYQVVEAKSIGADAILLIAACLSKQQTEKLARLAGSLGLEVIFEIHDKQELKYLNDFIDMVGVNNRNLKTFEVDIAQSVNISKYIPEGFVTISESGINTADEIIELKKAGFKGFLMGENFMRSPNPGEACKIFIKQLYNKEKQIEAYVY